MDLFGQMAPIEAVAAAVPGLPVIEDAAQSIGARRMIDGEWRMAGEVRDDRDVQLLPVEEPRWLRRRRHDRDAGRRDRRRDCKRLRVHGGAKQYFHDEVGYNSRLDALQAAVLSAKLPHLAGWSAKRRENAAYYDAAFADLARASRTPYVDPGERVDLQPVHASASPRRDALQAFLKERGIGTSIYYPLPLHLQPCFAYLGYQRRAVSGERARGEGSAVAADLSRAHARRSSTKSSRGCVPSSAVGGVGRYRIPRLIVL